MGDTVYVFTQLHSEFVLNFRYLVFLPYHNFLWMLWVFRGKRATSDISSWAHLINKWINYAHFMGWCTSKHFKGHAECPWGAVMRDSSTQQQIWWPHFMWTWSFSHFVCALAPVCLPLPATLFLLLPLTLFFSSPSTFSISPLRFLLIDSLLSWVEILITVAAIYL